MNQSKSGKLKRSRRAQGDEDDSSKLTKEENQIARYLRLNCPNKQGNLNGIKVDYFIGSKLVDCLMESKFGPGTLEQGKDWKYDEERQPILIDRHACFKYMQRLMQKQLFTRAFKVYKENPSVDTDAEATSNLKKRKNKDPQNSLEEKETTKNSPASSRSEKKEKKKFKLEIHDDQRFVDEAEPYVWTFDPVSTKSSIIGGLLILGAIAVCCFPLWPSFVREGVYYLSLAGCGFLGVIIALALIKYVIYAFLFVASLGSIEFWLLPNLTEDVGFIESFIPFYTLKVKKKETQESQGSDTIDTKSSTKDAKSDEEIKPEESTENVQATNDLTKSTVLVNSTCDFQESMKKCQEEYDYEMVENEEELNNK